MKILMVAATVKEAEPLWQKLNGKGDLSKGLNQLKWNDLEINLLITGVGLMQTAYHLGETLAKNNFDFAINFGVAGSFNKSLGLGEIVEITEDFVADAGAEDNDDFLDFADMKLIQLDEFPYKEGKLINNSPFNYSISKKVKKVKGISLNKATGSEKTIVQLTKKYDADTESLEGAAFFYSCLQENLSCIQLRAISNYVEPRNKDNWQLGKAISNMTEYLLFFLEEINAQHKKSL